MLPLLLAVVLAGDGADATTSSPSAGEPPSAPVEGATTEPPEGSADGAPSEAEPPSEEPSSEETPPEQTPEETPPEQTPPEEVPLEEVPLEEVPLEEAPLEDVTTEDEGVRTVKVRADPLGEASKVDVFRHAGGRTVTDRSEIEKGGAASVSEALDRTPGVRAVEGIAGVGSSATKLNVGVRGVNPRLSGRATVLLDGIPLAMAPYGQPELSLFPLSLFSIDRIDTVRGGASVRFGPQTAGGVFDLRSKPIPLSPELAISSRIDHFGQGSSAVGFGTTVDRFGVYVEYAPQYGRGYRDNSDVQVHGGLLKMAYAVTPRVDLQSTSHAYWEDSGLPGGLRRAQYEVDPFGTSRPDDRFHGWRLGEALTLTARPRDDQQFQVLSYYNHSVRDTRLTSFDDRWVVRLPRTFDALGVEPRHALRLDTPGGDFIDLNFGVRGALEWASLQRSYEPFATGTIEPSVDDDARLGALAAYVEQAHHLWDDRVVLRAGIRGEVVRASRRHNVAALDEQQAQQQVISRSFGALLPAASLWIAPIDELSMFLGYGRSFGPPSFVQLSAAFNTGVDLSTETTDTVELGLKLEDVVGLWGESTGWFRSFKSVRDVGEDSVGIVGDAYAAGVETELGWAPGDLWDGLTGTEIYAGHAFTRSIIHTSAQYRGKELAWYPRHEAWAGLGYALPWPCSFLPGVEGSGDCRALQVGGDVEWSGPQFADYNNAVVEPADGATGLIPSYTLLDAYLRFEMLLPRYWALNLTVGVKNVLDAEWYYRTDDINEGILRQRPRTFYATLDLKHWFFDAQQRAQERRDRRRQRHLRAATSGSAR